MYRSRTAAKMARLRLESSDESSRTGQDISLTCLSLSHKIENTLGSRKRQVYVAVQRRSTVRGRFVAQPGPGRRARPAAPDATRDILIFGTYGKFRSDRVLFGLTLAYIYTHDTLSLNTHHIDTAQLPLWH